MSLPETTFDPAVDAPEASGGSLAADTRGTRIFARAFPGVFDSRNPGRKRIFVDNSRFSGVVILYIKGHPYRAPAGGHVEVKSSEVGIITSYQIESASAIASGTVTVIEDDNE